MDIVYLKLVSGESLISYVETIDEEHVHVCKPLQIHTINSARCINKNNKMDSIY